MKKSKIIGGVVVVALVGLIAVRFLKPEEKAADYETRPTVRVETPETADIVLYTDLTGTIEPQSKASVQPKISGEVLEVYFQAGEQVTEGQVLCTIDSDALTSLRLQMEAAQVALNDANNTLARTQALFASGGVSQQSLEQAQNAAENARISYESAKNQYDLQVEYTQVTAPISGVIESRTIEPHDHVAAGSEICVISAKDQLQVNFGITEQILENLAVGDDVTVEKGEASYDGTVTEVGSMVNASTGLYDAKATLHDANGLTTGSRVKLTVVMDQALDAMTVPVDAVTYSGGQPFVYCYDNGTAVRTDIETGIYDSDRMEVVSGLTADSQVITSWSNELVDGAEVLLAGDDQTEDQEETDSQTEDTQAANESSAAN
ncbi:MAG TPA: efflux RND transporter periplasmic adaptor subunit [Candidatus Enterocloster faecavium]|uniref:Efflux RND transporter periplasmic adaptor subunit n=1 Tax=Candidatus Enterocloster faecavium TaxID=2838560 RepID=A0A9D2L8U3_9FIRM|nr:efflux RND transporter periplasmic adaptor subunit [Candidatus Enterocloster faecavium]